MSLKKVGWLFFLMGMMICLVFGEEAKEAKVGEMIPDVVVRSAESKELKLREAVKKRPTVFVFYRGGWCPFCQRHLMALSAIKDDLISAGYQIMAISPDQPSKLAEMEDREKLNYVLLSDSSMAAAQGFGIAFKVADDLVQRYLKDFQIDLEAASGKTHHMLPHPAVFVVDQAGVIRFAHVNPDYKKRLDPKEILKAVAGIKEAE